MPFCNLYIQLAGFRDHCDFLDRLETVGDKFIEAKYRASSAERKWEQNKPWFRKGQKWRTGCKGRISVVKPSRAQSLPGQGRARQRRWAGFGVIADNLINIGRFLSRSDNAAAPPIVTNR